LNLYYCHSLENVDGLANCTKLDNLHLSESRSVKPKPSRGEMTTRKKVAAYQERIKEAMQ
jgi:hypothetical protein